MMKIHTTQNLRVLTNDKQQSTSVSMNNSNVIYPHDNLMCKSNSGNVSFKKAPSGNQVNDVIRIVNGIKDKSSKSGKMKSKILSSDKFTKLLEFVYNNEVLTQAGIAFLVGWTLRVPTILALPEWLGGKHKEDKAYAAAHSGASVTVGLITAALLTMPVTRGCKYAREFLYSKVKPEMLKRRHPQLNPGTIKDQAGNLLQNDSFWFDTAGHSFKRNVKDPLTVARAKHVSEISADTFKALGIDIDVAANQGKAFHEMTTKTGDKLADVLKPEDMYIAVNNPKMGSTLKGMGAEYKDVNFFNLKYIDKDFLGKAIPDLDMKTVYGNDGKMLHPKNWKKTNGESAYDFDVYISSYLETTESMPFYTGESRVQTTNTTKGFFKRIKNLFSDKSDITSVSSEEKYVTYQRNGENGELGTKITTNMVVADKNIDAINKLMGWSIDIITKIPIGLLTVSLIPQILKFFDITKNAVKKEPIVSENNQIPSTITNEQTDIKNENKQSAVVFKGKAPSGGRIKDIYKWFCGIFGVSTGKSSDKYTKLEKWLGEKYAVKVMNSQKTQNFVERFGENFKLPMTQVMTILGSFMISSSYVFGTLKNDKLEPDRRRTLAINQTLGFIIPTFLGLFVNKKLDPKVKKLGYEYVGHQMKKIETLKLNNKITEEQAHKMADKVGIASKGMQPLAQLTIFTLIYRYFTPVAVTPVANWAGNLVNDKLHEKDAKSDVVTNK